MNHPRRETGLRCSKCGDPICTSCAVPTPVGMRCSRCAQVRRLPQFDIGPLLLLRSLGFGLVVSALLWLAVAFVPFLAFFLAILVGAGVGEVVSRSARRRTSRTLEIGTVAIIVLGLVLAEAFLPGSRLVALLNGVINVPGAVISLFLPLVVASFVAVLKLR